MASTDTNDYVLLEAQLLETVTLTYPPPLRWVPWLKAATVVAAGILLVLDNALGPFLLAAWVLWLLLGIRPRSSSEVQATGRICLGRQQMQVHRRGETASFPIDASTPIELRYGGYNGLPRGRKTVFDGTDNYLQLAGAEPVRFLLRDEQQLNQLRALLLAWYEQHVPVKEHYFDDRTFLLRPEMDYSEIQAFKQRYGVKLF